MARTQKIVHLHSNVYSSNAPKAPTSGTLAKGEIAVNYNDTEPAMFIENNSGTIVKFNAVQRSEISTINTNIQNLQGDVSGIKSDNKITLNGTQKTLTGSTWSFYAPTASGTSNTILASDGANKSPKWINQSAIDAGTVDGYHVSVVTSMPASPDVNTIYILK